MRAFIKHYIGALLGLVFGAVVATLTTMMIYGDLPGHEVEAFQQCLIEYTSTDK